MLWTGRLWAGTSLGSALEAWQFSSPLPEPVPKNSAAGHIWQRSSQWRAAQLRVRQEMGMAIRQTHPVRDSTSIEGLKRSRMPFPLSFSPLSSSPHARFPVPRPRLNDVSLPGFIGASDLSLKTTRPHARPSSPTNPLSATHSAPPCHLSRHCRHYQRNGPPWTMRPPVMIKPARSTAQSSAVHSTVLLIDARIRVTD